VVKPTEKPKKVVSFLSIIFRYSAVSAKLITSTSMPIPYEESVSALVSVSPAVFALKSAREKPKMT
jgi:hypothetical protein